MGEEESPKSLLENGSSLSLLEEESLENGSPEEESLENGSPEEESPEEASCKAGKVPGKVQIPGKGCMKRVCPINMKNKRGRKCLTDSECEAYGSVHSYTKKKGTVRYCIPVEISASEKEIGASEKGK